MTWGLDQTLITCFGVLGVAGTWLLKRGVWPRRSGETPHCANCGYTLLGVDLAVCPECGADLKESAAILHGERHRKPAVGWLGLILALAALGCGIAWVVRASADLAWYQIRPFTWILRDLDGPQDLAKQAVDEIDRRWVMDELKPVQFNQLFEHLLKEQASPDGRQNSQFPATMKFLAKGYQRGKLSDAQRQKFLDTALQLKLIVLPSDVGLPPLIRVVSDGAGPGRDSYIRRNTVLTELRWDGVPVPRVPDLALDGPLGMPLHTTISSADQKPGSHTLETFWTTTVEGTRDVKPFHRDEKLQTTVIVPPPPPPVAWERATSSTLVRSSIVPGKFTATVKDNYYMTVRGELEIKNAPTNLAYEVLGRFGDQYVRLGSLRAAAGKSGTVPLSAEAYAMDKSFNMTFVLRRSEYVAAAGKPPFKEAYAPSIFYNVPVQLIPPQDPAAK